MNPLRSVRARLALALLLVLASAFGIVYVVVTTTYEQSMIDTRLNGLEKNLRNIVSDAGPLYLTPDWVQEEAQPLAEARVVVLHRPERNGPVRAISDSSPPHGTSRDVRDDPVATEALVAYGTCPTPDPSWQCMSRGTVTRDGELHAEVAYPLSNFVVVLLTSSLSSQLDSASTLRKRLLAAGAIAGVFALLLGYWLATLFARRIERLDSAAVRIADGEFETPVVDTNQDELGQIARTFDRMRVRLAVLDRARAAFIANASHELRTPLHSLAGFLELLASEELDAETRADFMTAIRSQVTRLTKLATDLLDLSRLDAGHLSVATESLDLSHLADLLATEFGPRTSTSGHALELDVPESAPALGDENRVLQIGRILIENALVHTPPGTQIRLTASGDGSVTTLAVSDDGPGIEAEAQEHVFERFYRLDRSIASGSGLGLAIASELAALMGGRLDLVSIPGSTRFTLVLPADAADRPRLQGRAPALST